LAVEQSQHIAKSGNICVFPRFTPYEARQNIAQTKQPQHAAWQALGHALRNNGWIWDGRHAYMGIFRQKKAARQIVLLCLCCFSLIDTD
jgi:hypothetical protein